MSLAGASHLQIKKSQELCQSVLQMQKIMITNGEKWSRFIPHPAHKASQDINLIELPKFYLKL
jgi:hypothetical protein